MGSGHPEPDADSHATEAVAPGHPG